MAKRKKHASYSYQPTKKELYYQAKVKIRCRMEVATEIRDMLKPGSARSELFRGTCFGPWLDVRSTPTDSNLVHLILQTEYNPVMHQDALFFRVGGQELRFGPQEFCLITGMRFGPHLLEHGRADMAFRERVFGNMQASLKVSDLKDVFDSSLDQLSNLDAVRLCLLMLAEVGFLGRQSSALVDSALLELVEDLESWNTFPWGSYVWKVLYGQLHNALAKRSAQRALLPLNYSLEGFVWAFKIWIFEVFPYARNFASKHGGIPRAISWGKNKCITWKLALPFVMNATVPGFEPLVVLTPTPAECATDWWRASCPFFDSYANDSSPLSKKARLLSPPQPSVMVRDPLSEDIADTTTVPIEDIADTTTVPIEDIADTTTMSVEDITGTTTMPGEDIVGITTMPSSDNITNIQSTGCRENIEKTITSLDTHVDELYFANLKIRYHIAVATEIRFMLRPGSARLELFRGTCFGPWLDVQSTSNDTSLVHLILQTEYTPNPLVHQDALFFRVGGQELRFGPQEFCLITGLRFGTHHLEYGRATDMTFRERVFGHVEARPKVSDLKNVFNCLLDRLSDLDAIRICLLMLVEVGFMASDPRGSVDLILLELVEDLDAWNTFPWGSYVWKDVYKKLHNALAKRSTRRRDIPLEYTLSGFIWAFKIWIFEVFPYAKRFATKHEGIPRAISWSKNKSIKWKLALPFVMDATMPGLEPLPVLTPTPAECATDWWRASCQFFDGYANDSSPLLKKAHIPSPSQPSVMVRDQLAEDIADTTTMSGEDITGTTTMPRFDNSASQPNVGVRANMEKTMLENKLQEPLFMTCVTNLEECVDELFKDRPPHCVKTEMPTTSDLLGPFDHVEDHVVAGKISTQSDIICVQGYKVKQSVAPILESIFNKFGDIAADCIYKPASMRSSFLEIICEVVSRIQTNDDIDKMEGIEQQLLVAEAANINVSWLRAHLDAIRKRKEASRKCRLLMEMKSNTGLVKKAALMDLRESCVELMAAQERFEKAERCVRVLNVVEKNINDNILESKGNIDSGARQPLL